MASIVLKQIFSRTTTASCCHVRAIAQNSSRCFSTSQILLSNKEATEEQPQQEEQQTSKNGGFFKNLLRVRTLKPTKESHSSLLSSKETVYEIQFHAVKPEFMEDYLNQFSRFQGLMHEKKTGANLVASFTVEIGDQDEAVHIWEYKGGYPVLNNATEIYRTDRDFIEYRLARNKMLRSRKNQILLAFSFWPKLEPRNGKNIYEMRSYTLKAGTMIEWANCWARGIENRKTNNEPVGGFFSHLGEQYVVHHLWGYTDLQTRKETREAAWGRPGWDECVAYTVPLIRHMQSRILIPTPFSPLQ
ncbi:protein NipSnap-like isoform X2 [Mytilus californianus]|uniref:protein NipSnap-like isoform X2 n=1 Tax=Mytilus californianus TaxID=6549 RepID=UPI0022466D3D|nr:protein NipSnap-like isoform X2 [Mytilus californianus]